MGPDEPRSLLEVAFTAAATGAEPAEPEDDEITTRLLDAAHDQFCRMGVKRSTMADVAKLAGLSRITLYRRFATKDALFEQVVRREFRRYFDRFTADVSKAETVQDRVVEGFASSLRAIRDNPLIGGLMSTEPDAVLPSMLFDGGRTLAVVRRFVAGQLRVEQHAGTVDAEVDADLVAEMMVRTCASFLAIPSFVVDLDDEAQVRAVARRFLVPMLEPPRAP
ncbi:MULTISPECIES: TetR/AcrR family transcriptional regulator [Actinosynnema]|uniref:TetR/AcrR family transcriptional regulator n=1 Tax=Actinosynnema TaxID=40566 RepID=UPI0020A45228|nr:TetR/AcrR family transcriptional regulator [Actinosynnema pretiosum]